MILRVVRLKSFWTCWLKRLLKPPYRLKKKVAGQKNWGEGIIAITFVGKSQALF